MEVIIMSNNRSAAPIRRLAVAGLIAAMYAVLSLAVPALSFGQMQCRVSEALTVLAALLPEAIPGLAVGCLVTNLIGVGTGANIAGAWDILFGTAATLAAALLSYAFRRVRFARVPWLSVLPPIVINAVVIGLELTLVLFDHFSWEIFAVQAGFVALGQLISCVALGVPLFLLLEKHSTRLLR